MHILRITAASFKSEMQKIKDGLESQIDYKGLLHIVLKTKSNNIAAISMALRKQEYQVTDVIHDVEWLQKKWAEERSFKYSENKWWKEILAEQINFYQPDILFIQHTCPFSKAEIAEIKATCKIKAILLHTGYLGSVESIGPVDHIFAATPSLAFRYSKQSYSSSVLYHYFDESLIEVFADIPRVYDFTFVGASGYSSGYVHSERYWLLRRLFEETDLKGWLLENEVFRPANWKAFLKEILKKTLIFFPKTVLCKFSSKLGDTYRNTIEEFMIERSAKSRGLKLPCEKIGLLYPSRVEEPVAGLSYYEIIAKSKISFHAKGTSLIEDVGIIYGDIGAIRLFEATGLGSCLLSDSGKNMSDLFEDGKEIVTYSCPDEAIEKAKYLIGNPLEAAQIAKKGQERTLRSHTALNRAVVINEWIRTNL